MRIIGSILLIILGCSLWAQQTDSLATSIDTVTGINKTALGIDSLIVLEHVDFLYQRILEDFEVLAEESEDSEIITDELEELLAEYEFHREQPININSEEITQLDEMGLLSAFQIEALRKYRKWYGDLLYIEELMMVEGFDEHSVAVITPIVYCGKSEKVQEQERLTWRKALTRGKHQLTLNYAQKIEESEAYDEASDSLLMAKPNTYYLGNPTKLQIKYGYSYGTHLRFGIAMEKDAGEPFLFGHLSDTIKRLVDRSPGFDFYGLYLYATDMKIRKDAGHGASGGRLVIKDLAIGDYQLSFGQGLTLWSGMSLGKTSGSSSLMKRGAGVRPKASAGEGKFFRGIATTLAFRELEATAFYSTRRIDATVVETDSIDNNLDELLDDSDDPLTVSALQETGYHRSLGELAKRHTLRQQVFGGRLAYAGSQLEIGGTAYHLRLSAPLLLKPSKYNQFFFQGDRLTVTGIDFRWLLNKAVFYGELSMSDNIAFAGLVGLTVKPKGYIDFTLMYRNFGTQYQNLFFGAVKESSRGQAEESFYLGLHCAPAPSWDLLAHCDLFRFKWLTSQVYTPSWGQEYNLQVSHQLSHNASMQLKIKSKTKMKNSTDNHVFSYYPIFYTKRSVQFQLSYTVRRQWILSNKASYSHYFNDDGIDSQGVFICQDVSFKPDGRPYSLTFRYALYESDDYNSRISVYENDVLGAFSIPSLYGKGSRFYLLGKLKLFNALSIYARIGCSFLSEETRTDVKAEMIWKF